MFFLDIKKNNVYVVNKKDYSFYQLLEGDKKKKVNLSQLKAPMVVLEEVGPEHYIFKYLCKNELEFHRLKEENLSFYGKVGFMTNQEMKKLL